MRNVAGIGAAMLLAGAAAPPAERVVTGDGVTAATVKGAPGRLRIDPAATAMPMIDAAWAERAGLKAGPFGIMYGVGPKRVSGRTAVAELRLGGLAFKRRIAWTPRPYAAGVDGVIGPAGLPDPVVRFVLRPARPGERVARFPMVDQGGLFGGWSERFAVIEVGGSPMRLRFDPHHRRTLANAGAGRRLAEAHGGALTGEVTPEEIAFGIERPVRTLVLARPLRLGPLSIASLGVRTHDGGGTTGIADADAPPDPDEVVVTARGKRDPDRNRLALGRDQLDRCSSIVFDKPARQVRLSCI